MKKTIALTRTNEKRTCGGHERVTLIFPANEPSPATHGQHTNFLLPGLCLVNKFETRMNPDISSNRKFGHVDFTERTAVVVMETVSVFENFYALPV